MADDLQLAPGQLFAGDFEVLRALARGGMGAVYLVRQRSTNKQRALKTMLPQLLTDPSQRARFTREAQVGSLIESDHLVEVVSAGVDEATGAPWLVMEFLKGAGLDAVLSSRGRLAPSEVDEVVRQLGHALSSAHRVGVVHRDLKPENLFLSEPRRDGVPFTLKVLDFGIARLVQEASSTTAAVGTPLWMAPEQAEPGGDITPATDIWALGLLVFRLLTGRPYWRTPNTPNAAVVSLLRELLFEALPPASERAASLGVEALLPPSFDAWFAHCVARDPRERFRDASAAVAALRSVLAPSLSPLHASSAPSPAPLGALAAMVTEAALRGPSPDSIRPAGAPPPGSSSTASPPGAGTRQGTNSLSLGTPTSSPTELPSTTEPSRASALALAAQAVPPAIAPSDSVAPSPSVALPPARSTLRRVVRWVVGGAVISVAAIGAFIGFVLVVGEVPPEAPRQGPATAPQVAPTTSGLGPVPASTLPVVAPLQVAPRTPPAPTPDASVRALAPSPREPSRRGGTSDYLSPGPIVTPSPGVPVFMVRPGHDAGAPTPTPAPEPAPIHPPSSHDAAVQHGPAPEPAPTPPEPRPTPDPAPPSPPTEAPPSPPTEAPPATPTQP